MIQDTIVVDAHVHAPRLATLKPAWLDWADTYARDHPGAVPRGRRCPGDRHDQRGRRVGWICRHLHRRGPRRSGLGRPVGLPRGLPPRRGAVDVRGAPSAWRGGSRPSGAACPVTVRSGGACAGDRPAAPCLSPAAARAAEPCGGGIRTQVHRDVDVRPYARFPTSAAAGPRSRGTGPAPDQRTT